ncbi:hypothetical protein F5882DRAFT_27303 [Hyaloscypha sp. PMI_1271]|nr:hypothetical protein F5882DRAFT_27303 [Hyaloscypha sp. PMI_1271]
MEERGRYDVQSNGEPSGAQQSDFPLYEYIRLNILLNRVPADDTFEVFYRQCRHLMKQTKDTGVLPDDCTDNIILCISKKSWDFEYISHRLRLLGGELTKEKLYEWLVSQGNGEEIDQLSGCPISATLAPSAPSPTPSTSLSGERPTQTPSQAATEPNQAHPNNIFTNEGRLATCQSIIHNTQKKIIRLRKEQFNDIYMEFKRLCEISCGVTKGEIPRFVLPLLKNVLAKTGKTPQRLPRSNTRCATPQDNLCLPVRNPYSWTGQDHRNLDKSRGRSPPHLP